MAEKNASAKAGNEDANETKRMVLAGFELEVGQVARNLVKTGFGQVPETLATDKDAQEGLAAEVKERLSVDGVGKVICWVEIGVEDNTDKTKAIAQALGGGRFLGFYRAPAQRAWKGGIAKRPPAQIEPDVEALD